MLVRAARRSLPIYGLIVAGIQANYAAATSSLRFQPDADTYDVASEGSEATS